MHDVFVTTSLLTLNTHNYNRIAAKALTASISIQACLSETVYVVNG